MSLGSSAYQAVTQETSPSKLGKFLSELPIESPKRPFPPKWEKWNLVYFRLMYFVLRKLFKKSHPLEYVRAISPIVVTLMEGYKLTEKLDTNIIIPADFKAVTDSLNYLREQLVREEILRNISAFDPLKSATIRSLSTNVNEGISTHVEAHLHIAAHAMMTYALADMLLQPKGFFVGKNDAINVRIVTNGLKNLTIYMESILSFRL